MSVDRIKNIDTVKIEKEINDRTHNSCTIERYEKEKIEQYYDGYRRALYEVSEMLYCSNYEKDKEKEGK